MGQKQFAHKNIDGDEPSKEKRKRGAREKGKELALNEDNEFKRIENEKRTNCDEERRTKHTADERQLKKYSEGEKISKVAKVKKPSKKAKDKDHDGSNFVSQCRPLGLLQLLDIINSNPKQKNDIESIGFGGLLKMRVKQISTYMLEWLVKRFNGKSRLLTIDDKKQVVITADDICDIFLLPRNDGREVLVGKRKDDALDIACELKEKYGIDGQSSVSFLQKLLMGGFEDGGDDFKRLFVLYTMSTFLTPTANRKVDLSFLKSLVDVDTICQFDWCSFVLERLCKAVDNYNKKSRANISGCVLALQIIYFHRLKWKGKAEPSSLPLIQHWTSENIRRRVKEEREAGAFGQGDWITDTYPVSGRAGLEGEEKVHYSSGAKADDKASGAKEECVDESSRLIKFELPEGELTNAEIHKLAKDDVHETFLLLKRDMAVVFDFHMDRLNKMKKKMEPNQPQVPQVSSSQSPILSQTQNFFANDKVQKFIDDVVEKFNLMKKLSEEMPNFDLLTPETKQLSGDDDGFDEALASAVLKPRRDLRVEYVGLPADAWAVGEDAGYVSSFMTQNKRLLVDMDIRDKQVLDFCLFDTEPFFENDLFFTHDGLLTISKNEILSLNQKRWIYGNVIDAWVLILNRAKASDDPCKRVFFDTGHSFYMTKAINKVGVVAEHERSMRKCWQKYMEHAKQDLSTCDLIFVPIHFESHFFCAVVNFRDEKMQFLDNRKYDDPSHYIRVVQLVKYQMAIFLEEKNHPKARDVAQYSVEYVNFPWQSEDEANDCGVFLMHHMEYFKGKIYTSPDDLSKALVRRVLRAQICLRIFLSDLNGVRLEILKKIVDFCLKKSDLKQKIEEKKKTDADLKRKGADLKKKKKKKSKN